MKSSPWWKEAVIYQIYPSSFFDSNGDGEGDLNGISSKLEYIKMLGVDAIWLSPFYKSPNKDGGYDVADPRDVDPRFGTLADAKKLIDLAHKLELKILIDVVPNHFSDQHIWFQEALQTKPGSPERARFHFNDAKEDGTPPNNWISLFGGSSWAQVPDGQYYLHLFDSSQPDLNWNNPEVAADFERTLRFWLDLGVDGFRIDVAQGLVKEDVLEDHPDPQGLSDALRLDSPMDPQRRAALLPTVPYFDREGVHEIYRDWRKIFDSYKDREVMAVAEAWVHPPINATKYVSGDELHQVFNFDLLDAPFEATYLFEVTNRAIDLMATVEALPTWALSSHDSPRVASRIGELQSRALALFILAMPGSCYIYAGQELGLPDGNIPDEARRDPIYLRSGGNQKGRDGARVPLPWNGDQTPFGFTTGKPWLPLQQDWHYLTVEKQEIDSMSTLAMYRNALKIRSKSLDTSVGIDWINSPTIGKSSPQLLAFKRGNLSIYMNLSDTPIEIEISGKILISSVEIKQNMGSKLALGPISTVWIQN